MPSACAASMLVRAPSMGSAGDAYDNAHCESFFATLGCELIDQHRLGNKAEVRMASFDFIEKWCNPHRHRSGLVRDPPSTSRGITLMPL